MEKEFEALKELEILKQYVKVKNDWGAEYTVDSAYNTVKQALTELKSIKEAKPSEAMEILNEFSKGLVNKEIGMICFNQIWFENQIEILKQTLQSKSLAERCWEICREKCVEVNKIYSGYTLEEYNKNQYRDCELTEAEFNTLKEGLK